MTTARTLLTIVKQYCQASEMSGLRPQQIKYSMKKLSDLTGLSREAIRDALKDTDLGFKESNSGWKIGKDFKLKDVETNFKALSGDSIKLMWWAALPEYDWEAHGSNINVTHDEQIALSLVRKTLAEGKSLDDIGVLLGKELNPKVKEREVKKEVVKVKDECDKEHIPAWLMEVSHIIRAVDSGELTLKELTYARRNAAANTVNSISDTMEADIGMMQNLNIFSLYLTKKYYDSK